MRDSPRFWFAGGRSRTDKILRREVYAESVPIYESRGKERGRPVPSPNRSPESKGTGRPRFEPHVNSFGGKILIIRGGAIGDFILTLPALAALRRQFPDAHLEVLGYPHIAQLAVAG